MRKIALLILVSTFLISCQSNKRNVQETNTDTIAPVTRSLPSYTELTHIYEGTIPAPDGPGIRYHLTINNQRNTNNGSYILRTTYLKVQNGKDQTFTTRGITQKLRGSATDENALIYKLIADDESKAAMYFMEIEDHKLRLLNENLEDSLINTNLNYEITMIN